MLRYDYTIGPFPRTHNSVRHDPPPIQHLHPHRQRAHLLALILAAEIVCFAHHQPLL